MDENIGISNLTHSQYHAAVVRRGLLSLPSLLQINWLMDNMSFVKRTYLAVSHLKKLLLNSKMAV